MVQRHYAQTRTIATVEEIDAGLRAYMNKVYALMAGAMILTGVFAYVVGMDLKAVFRDGTEPAFLSAELLSSMYLSPFRWVLMFAPLVFVFAFAAMIHRMSTPVAQAVFWAFGAVMGISIATIFVRFTGVSIAQTFFATAAAFGAMSIYGYTTKKDLSGWGTFLMMGVFGIIIASLLNIFIFQSGMMVMVISAIGVLIFAGLTAYDTQRIKNEYLHYRTVPGGEAVLDKGAIMGALGLYINFLNMFMFLLNFMGDSD